MVVAQCDHKRRKTHRQAILKELRELQEIAMIDMRSPDTSAAVRAQLMRAYVAVQEMRNVEKMRPAPKPIDVSTLKRGKAKASLAPEAPASMPTTKPQEG